MELEHRLDIKVDLHGAHFKGNSLERALFVQQAPLSEHLIGQEGGCPVEYNDLDFSVGKLV